MNTIISNVLIILLCANLINWEYVGTPIDNNCPSSAKVNEFHYDNTGIDTNEFVEIILLPGSDPTQIRISLYTGAEAFVYDSYILAITDFISSDGTFDYYVWYPQSIQNGPDGIAISCVEDDTPYQLISYEGTFTPVNGPFAGITSTDVGVAEIPSSTSSTQSIMCDGSGTYTSICTADPGFANNLSTCIPPAGCTNLNACNYSSYAVVDDGSCYFTGDSCDDGNANTANDILTDCDTCEGVFVGTCPTFAKINEFHYNDNAADENEFVEIILIAGTDPTLIQVDLYNGNDGNSYDSIVLQGTNFVSTDGTYDYYVWMREGIQNGPDGIAVSCIDGTQFEFITYGDSFTANDGPFAGVTGTYIGVQETMQTDLYHSIMCDGNGNYAGFCTADAGFPNNFDTCNYWGGCVNLNACNYSDSAANDDGSCYFIGGTCDDNNLNTVYDVWIDCNTCLGTLTGTCPTFAKINEFHYDNFSIDANEFVEIILPTGTDPTLVKVDLYNGNNGSSYDSIILGNINFVSTDGTYDYYVWNVNNMQNGPDGIAISCVDGTQYQFISYEDDFFASDGPFAGVLSNNIGVQEDDSTLDTQSIMCNGNGTYFTGCTANPGFTNNLNSCSDIEGCTDLNACNYNAAAALDNGSCIYIGDACNDGDILTINDVLIDCNTCIGINAGLTNCINPTWEVISPLQSPNAVNIEWTYITNGFTMNGYCGSSCADNVSSWLVFGPLNVLNTNNLNLYLEAIETFGTTDLNVYYTSDYSSGCPATTSWTFVSSIIDSGTYHFDLSNATGAFVYIGIEYADDGSDRYSQWELTNFQLLADVCPSVGSPITSNCNLNLGCTDITACNFNASATFDDGSCYNTGDPCDDNNQTTTNDIWINCNTCLGTIINNCPTSAKINEFHYDNIGADVNEFVEIVLPAGSDPTSVQVDLYNGSGGVVYNTIILSNTFFVSSDGINDYYVWYPGNIQNGPSDGIAISCIDGTQYQFISYEGAFTATGGPFAGVMSVDIGVAEGSTISNNQSIMCDGMGNYLAYCIADAGSANNISSCICDPAVNNNCVPSCTQTISFNPGWNLISLDVSPADKTIQNLFNGPLAGNLEFVTTFDNGFKTFDPDLPSPFNSLQEVEDGFGYWVKVANNATLTFQGVCIADDFLKTFDAGWNLVAYPPDAPQPPAMYFSDLISNGELQFVTGFDGGTITFDPAIPGPFNSLQLMENGFGYWAKVTNAF